MKNVSLLNIMIVLIIASVIAGCPKPRAKDSMPPTSAVFAASVTRIATGGEERMTVVRLRDGTVCVVTNHGHAVDCDFPLAGPPYAKAKE